LAAGQHDRPDRAAADFGGRVALHGAPGFGGERVQERTAMATRASKSRRSSASKAAARCLPNSRMRL